MEKDQEERYVRVSQIQSSIAQLQEDSSGAVGYRASAISAKINSLSILLSHTIDFHQIFIERQTIAGVVVDENSICYWTRNEIECQYETSCGEAYILITEAGLAEANCKFCMNCSKRIIERDKDES
jgi:hypothetical protein